ncbi:molybdenum cofactor synthesis protein cinnamon [Scaptodrosophila lebanonensis]|uniref:Molybdenum cofactor synthesis protein cinnamon n=1 Tax=Drosophila lebanonensis TaxID=7225 RepID=A0A6J2U4H7_DROLE|nr:molybdenum cofactor synthesis protein cinnamon [Scaptodrosophila lebanonensis]
MGIITFGVLTISDTCYSEPDKDRSGPCLAHLIKQAFSNTQIIEAILPDERDLIQRELRKWIDKKDVRVIITTGGTGFAPRDVTPEATKPLLDKDCSQLAMAIAIASLQKTKLAALSRGVCGIAGNTLVLNFPGSEKAVRECFEVVRDLLPHALHLLNNDLGLVQRTHAELQATVAVSPVRREDPGSTNSSATPSIVAQDRGHICPHRTGAGDDNDRNSSFPMLPVKDALDIVFNIVQRNKSLEKFQNELLSPVNIPPFRASIKDGYAVQSQGFAGAKRVVGCVAAGDEPSDYAMQEDECFKINTGAAMPVHTNCVVQVEDTKVLQRDRQGNEKLVETLVQPTNGYDVRPIGCDLRKGEKVFPEFESSRVVSKSLLASVGVQLAIRNPKIAIISTGSELLAPHQPPEPGKIYDSNSTMLDELLTYFGFDCIDVRVLSDNFETIQQTLSQLYETVDFVICTGGVSMGDKDFIKPVLESMKFKLHFGRVNMKPGKPMTFASRDEKYFFGLPGNPVSAFVTFHLFALPAIRWAAGWNLSKSMLPIIDVKLRRSQPIQLDPRPEYIRASVSSKNGKLYATINGDQISSRLQSIVGADVLIHFPGRSAEKSYAMDGDIYPASVLRFDFISQYE